MGEIPRIRSGSLHRRQARDLRVSWRNACGPCAERADRARPTVGFSSRSEQASAWEVRRERLLRRLRALPEPRVHVVHAPPGYGKSTLAAQYVAEDGRDAVWLTLNEADADPVRLVADLAFALDVDGVGPDALAGLVDVLVHRARDSLIVLDDIHHAATREASDVLAVLVDSVPPESTLVLAARARPHLPIARLVASGHIDMITARDLRMTVREGTAMLRGLGAEIDGEEAELVVRRTEGWPAAIYLVSLMAREDVDGGELALGGDLVDYLHDEVLRSVDPERVRFLSEASILEELDPAVCDPVLERSDSAACLRSLADADVFVAALDGHGGSYRMHGLFREALQERLQRAEPTRARGLHRRAATHFAERGRVENAVRHALAAGDTGAAADLVWSATPEYESRGEGATLARWLGWFSPEAVTAHPCLALTGGWIAIDGGDGDAAEHWTAVARGAPPGLALCTGEPIAAHVLLLEAALGKRGIEAVGEAAGSADRLLPADAPLRALAQMLAGTAAYLGGDAERARSLLLDAQTASASKLPTVYGLALAQLSLIAIDESDWEEAESCMARVWLDARGALRDYVSMALCSTVDALIHAHRGDQFAAREAAANARRALAVQRHYAPWYAAQARMVLATAYLALEFVPDARTMVAQARSLIGRDRDALRLHDGLRDLASRLERAAGVAAGHEVLTRTEMRTLRQLASHLTQQEIADRLSVSRHTVHTHTNAIYRKLDVSSRSAAVARAHDLGLLDETSPTLDEVR